MKISKIEKVLKQAPNIYLMDEDETNIQWIGNDYAAFPLWDFPRIEVEDVYTILNIDTPKEREKFYIEAISQSEFKYDIHDTIVEEYPVGKRYPDIVDFGIQKRIYQFEQGVMIVPSFSFKPFESDKNEDYTYIVRYKKNGRPYLAVKRGLEVSGFINCGLVMKEEGIQMFEELAMQFKLTAYNYAEKSAEEQMEMSTEVDTE